MTSDSLSAMSSADSGATSMPERLYYWGTGTEVLVGDYIRYRPFFSLKPKAGRVIYLPNESGRRLSARGQDPDEWYIELESGVRYGWLYSPEDLQPNKRLTFVRRGEVGFQPISSKTIEDQESEESSRWIFPENIVIVAVVLLGLVAWALF